MNYAPSDRHLPNELWMTMATNKIATEGQMVELVAALTNKCTQVQDRIKELEAVEH